MGIAEWIATFWWIFIGKVFVESSFTGIMVWWEVKRNKKMKSVR